MIPDQVVVLTGPIGSGKSFVADVFRQRGWLVTDADSVGHDVLDDPAVATAIGQRWPIAIAGTRVDRRRLAALVFANPEELAALESLTHPDIQYRITKWLAHTSGGRVVEVSVPKVIAIGWGLIVVVDASEPLRLARLLDRGIGHNEVVLRMQNQPPRQDWLALAQIVVNNESPGGSAGERLIDHLESN